MPTCATCGACRRHSHHTAAVLQIDCTGVKRASGRRWVRASSRAKWPRRERANSSAAAHERFQSTRSSLCTSGRRAGGRASAQPFLCVYAVTRVPGFSDRCNQAIPAVDRDRAAQRVRATNCKVCSCHQCKLRSFLGSGSLVRQHHKPICL